jgi:hypothetical protein
MLRPLLLLAIPAWSAAAVVLVRVGGRRAAWVATLLLALALAAWAGSRVGTANPVSRTARWDPWLAAVLAAALLGVPGAAITWSAAATAGRPLWFGFGAGILGGLVALPVAFALAVLVEMLWPH